MTYKAPKPIRIPIPGLQRTVGAGQIIRRLTASVGIQPCSGCGRRARALDRHLVFTPQLGSKR